MGGACLPGSASRMAELGRLMVEALVLEYGRGEVLRRLANPFWFQSLGCVMGMDWHSSGITTSVLGALKRGLAPVAGELGLYVCGGRGRHSRQTPAELQAIGERRGWTGRRWRGPAGWWPRWTAPQSRTASSCTCTASSSPPTAAGRWCSRG